MGERAWGAIFRFEVRYHLRQPLFYLVAFVLGALLFVAGTGQGPGAVGRLDVNAPAVILEQLVKGIFLVLFLLTAFVSSAAVRDFERGTSELFLSYPVSRTAYLTGRFAGTVTVCALAYLIGAAALAAGSRMPWVDPARLGPFRLAPYAFGLGVLVLPTLLALGAAFHALASWTRSTIATYAGVVAFFAASTTAGWAASHLEARWIGELLDPFGVTALGGALRYWTTAELNASVPRIGGTLLWNRVLWLVLGFSALGLVAATFDPARPHRRRRPRETEVVDAPAPVRAPSPPRTRPVRPASARGLVILPFLHRLRLETRFVLGNLPFLGILALGLFVLVQGASAAGSLFGTPVHPQTHRMVEALRGGYSIVLLLVVVLFSAELVWKERAAEVDEVHDSLPVPGGLYLGAKLAALLLVIAAWMAVGVAALIGFQLASGYRHLELGQYARGAAMAAVYPALMPVLACFCHVVARGRIAGYGLVILFIVAWDVLEELGFEDHLYRYASLPPTPWSDFGGYGPFLAPFAWTALYWGCAAVVLAGLTALLWRRGTDTRWKARRREARARFRGLVRAGIVLGAAGTMATGAWIFRNTHVLNAYVPSTEAADARAEYERLYRRFRGMELPRIVAVRADVDIFPERRRLEIRGSYRLHNRSAAPLRDIHLSIPARVRLDHVRLPAHDVVLRDDARGYHIYRLRAPLAPGGEMEVGFDLTVENRGFVNHGTDVTLVENGTFFTRRDVFPVIGYDDHRQLADPDERRERGLEPLLRLPDVGDLAARRTTPRAPDADRVAFETTVSTSLDQIAVTSGALEREWVAGGRRHFRYRAEVPITHHFAFASARYAVTRAAWNGIAIEVYHHPTHGGNVGRMMDAAEASLAYLTASLGPYPHRALRIVEFPGYVRDATSFPGMIAFSESMGFNARPGGSIDYPFYVTAHEVAHQWWGQQVVGAEVRGVGMLHETLAQHAALMVMEAALGRPAVGRVLERELDEYLRGRGGARGVEPPLARVEREEHVYYHKGALAMYALRDAVGEARLNAALSRFFARAAVTEPPYATTNELLEEIRRVVPAEEETLVADLFERVTSYRNRVVDATYAERADGRFRVRLTLASHKLQADSAGTEREVPSGDWMDVAVFGEGGDGDARGPMLFSAARRVGASPAVVEVVVDRRPAWVVIDPLGKLIDRDRDDNARRIDRGSSARPEPR